MYCRECGKEINYQAEICHECAAKRAQAATTPAVQPTTNNIMLGFGKALTGAILSYIGQVFIAIVYGFSIIIFEGANTIPGGSFYPMAIFCIIAGCVLSVIALIFGFLSIKTFIKVSKQGSKKPIPALIIGIVTLLTVISTVIYLLITIAIILTF